MARSGEYLTPGASPFPLPKKWWLAPPYGAFKLYSQSDRHLDITNLPPCLAR